ncbi:MAG: hypothetical protein HOP31_15080 [Ignavibacteria bacterium]|nr:hypothetical protein [Ignavibacteria bacterium]
MRQKNKFRLVILGLIFISPMFLGEGGCDGCETKTSIVDPSPGRSGAVLIYKTGKSSNWITMDFPEYRGFSDFEIGPNNVFMMPTYEKFVGKSTNYGANWIFPVVVDTLAVNTEFVCSYYNDIQGYYITTSSGNIFISGDDGLNWTKIAYNNNFGTCSGIEFVQKYPTGITGIGLFHSGIFRTTDGGYNWNNVYTESSFNDLAYFYISGANAKFAALRGYTGGIHYSSNDGLNWAPVSTHINNINAIECFGEFGIIAAGDWIAYSPDRGATWQNVTPASYVELIRTDPIVDLYASYPGEEVTAVSGQGRIYYNVFNNPQEWLYYDGIPNGNTITVSKIHHNGYDGTFVMGKY